MLVLNLELEIQMNLAEMLKSNRPPKKDDITDEDLARLFMKYKGLLKRWERDRAFSAATHENIRIASAKLDELVEQRTTELRKTNEQLKAAEARLRHLNLVLRAIRNVNQLIVKEKDRDRLLKGVCDDLIKTRGYYDAWLAIWDEAGELVGTAEAGLGKDFLPMVEQLRRGDLPTCCRQALRQAAVVAIKDSFSTCGDCPLRKKHQRGGTLAVRLEHDEKLHGLLVASVPAEFAGDEEERSLLQEVGGDIAFALHDMELEEKRRRAEEELRRYREHLEELVDERTKELRDAQEELLRAERLATLGQFSGNISHELRNPLGVIDSSVYYLKTKLGDADKKVREHLDRISGSVSRSTAIIESLLNLTRMKEPQLERFDPTDITAEAIATSKVPATVKVVQNFPQQQVLVDADGEQLCMAFQNIIKNAIEAMDNRGILTVTARVTTDRQAEVSFTDNGPGIAAEDLGKVFQPLFSTKAKGIGFGLSISRMIVERHGGTIEARSEPGEGAAIIIRLPLASREDREDKEV